MLMAPIEGAQWACRARSAIGSLRACEAQVAYQLDLCIPRNLHPDLSPAFLDPHSQAGIAPKGHPGRASVVRRSVSLELHACLPHPEEHLRRHAPSAAHRIVL